MVACRRAKQLTCHPEPVKGRVPLKTTDNRQQITDLPSPLQNIQITSHHFFHQSGKVVLWYPTQFF